MKWQDLWKSKATFWTERLSWVRQLWVMSIMLLYHWIKASTDILRTAVFGLYTGSSDDSKESAESGTTTSECVRWVFDTSCLLLKATLTPQPQRFCFILHSIHNPHAIHKFHNVKVTAANTSNAFKNRPILDLAISALGLHEKFDCIRILSVKH